MKKNLIHLKKKLVLANLEKLQQLMLDKNLSILLTTKAEQLPSAYQFLVREISEDYKDKTLYDLIATSLNYNIKGTKTFSYFSEVNQTIVGFIAYIVFQKEVIEIKIFSFDLKHNNLVLLRDLKYLLDQLVEQYIGVSWTALIENPANKIYEKVLKDYQGKRILEEKGFFVIL
jgi:hypothetical protein